jgi:hypothetical protein
MDVVQPVWTPLRSSQKKQGAVVVAVPSVRSRTQPNLHVSLHHECSFLPMFRRGSVQAAVGHLES